MLVAEGDRNGNTTTLTYNSAGQLTMITDPSNRTITLAYNADGQIQSATDPKGQAIDYGYDGNGNLTSVTYAGESSPRWRFAYDDSHQLVALTDGNGNATSFVYNAYNQVTQRVDPLGRTTGWAYYNLADGDGETHVTNPNGSVTVEIYHNYQPTQITDAYGTGSATTKSLSYDDNGELVRRTDGAGNPTTYTYDADGNKTSQTDGSNDTTRWTYDDRHDVLTTTTPIGETTTYTLDAHGNALAASRPAPNNQTEIIRYTYNAAGEQTSKTDPNNNPWTYGYDAYGDQAAVTDPLGNETTYVFDADSRKTSETTPRGNAPNADPATHPLYTTTFTLDDRGRTIRTEDGLNHVTIYGYDGNDNRTDVTDPDGNHTHTVYDADNEATQVVNADQTTSETAYDAAGQVVTQTNGDAEPTTYARNHLEQITSVTDPLNRETIKTYDAAGNLQTVVDPEGRTTTYSYDPANRLTGVTYSDGTTPPVTYKYDADGDRTNMTDGTGTTTHTYDQLDRLTAVTNGAGSTVSYAYDLANNETAITYPNGQTVTRSFDADERLQTVADWAGNTTTFAYDPDSNLASTTFPASTGEADQYAYDGDGEMSGVTMLGSQGTNTLASISYTRDQDEQVLTETSTGLAGGNHQYSYDARKRLTEDGSASYGYDAAGNPTTIHGTQATYDAAGELQGVAGTTFTSDALGDRVSATTSSGATTTYTYDQAGRLTTVAGTGGSATQDAYSYDGTGLRQQRVPADGGAQNYTWDPTAAFPLLLGDGAESYLYGPGDLPVEQIDANGTPVYLHRDQLGSTRLLTDSTGTIVGSATYTATGQIAAQSGTATSAIGWAGQYRDSDTGLVYMRARYYDPTTGQFISQDPSVMQTQMPYAYAADDPTNLTDPTGLTPWSPQVQAAVAKCGYWKWHDVHSEYYTNRSVYLACQDLLQLPSEIYGTGNNQPYTSHPSIGAILLGGLIVVVGTGVGTVCGLANAGEAATGLWELLPPTFECVKAGVLIGTSGGLTVAAGIENR